jgi:hypothetical protein
MNAKLAAAVIFTLGFGLGLAVDHWAGAAIPWAQAGAARPSTRLLLPAAETSAPVASVVTMVVERTVPAVVGDLESLAWTPPPIPDEPERSDRGSEHWGGRTNGGFAERMAEFTNEWARRAAAGRSNFIAAANLGEAEVARFDVVVAAMNIRLADVLDPVIADLQAGLPITPADRARLVKELGDVLVLTYDELSRGLPDTPVQGVTSNPVNVVQFADPRYMPFLRGFGGRRSWGGTR